LGAEFGSHKPRWSGDFLLYFPNLWSFQILNQIITSTFHWITIPFILICSFVVFVSHLRMLNLASAPLCTIQSILKDFILDPCENLEIFFILFIFYNFYHKKILKTLLNIHYNAVEIKIYEKRLVLMSIKRRKKRKLTSTVLLRKRDLSNNNNDGGAHRITHDRIGRKFGDFFHAKHMVRPISHE